MTDFEKQEAIREVYEADFYDESVEAPVDITSGRFYEFRIAKVLEIYSPTKEEYVVDLGCALGTFCFVLAPRCKQVIGVDYSTKAIAICNNLQRKSPNNNVKFICSAVHDTGLESGSVDVVICADLVEHLYPAVFEKTLDESRRLLRKHGKLVVWTPHRGHIIEILANNDMFLKRNVTHVDYKSMDCLLNNLQKRNFAIKKAYYTESHIPVFRIFEKLLLPVLPVMRRRIAVLAEKE
jgi:2-polyprenyl-3-methyl-5-hydroxy-6-metoxy-1,4-benzoquinol methylase